MPRARAVGRALLLLACLGAPGRRRRRAQVTVRDNHGVLPGAVVRATTPA